MSDKHVEKVYWSDAPESAWNTTGNSLTYWVCPKKWWSINDWKLALEFRKAFTLWFMRKD